MNDRLLVDVGRRQHGCNVTEDSTPNAAWATTLGGKSGIVTLLAVQKSESLELSYLHAGLENNV